MRNIFLSDKKFLSFAFVFCVLRKHCYSIINTLILITIKNKIFLFSIIEWCSKAINNSESFTEDKKWLWEMKVRVSGGAGGGGGGKDVIVMRFHFDCWNFLVNYLEFLWKECLSTAFPPRLAGKRRPFCLAAVKWGLEFQLFSHIINDNPFKEIFE